MLSPCHGLRQRPQTRNQGGSGSATTAQKIRPLARTLPEALSRRHLRGDPRARSAARSQAGSLSTGNRNMLSWCHRFRRQERTEGVKSSPAACGSVSELAIRSRLGVRNPIVRLTWGKSAGEGRNLSVKNIFRVPRAKGMGDTTPAW